MKIDLLRILRMPKRDLCDDSTARRARRVNISLLNALLNLQAAAARAETYANIVARRNHSRTTRLLTSKNGRSISQRIRRLATIRRHVTSTVRRDYSLRSRTFFSGRPSFLSSFTRCYESSLFTSGMDRSVTLVLCNVTLCEAIRSKKQIPILSYLNARLFCIIQIYIKKIYTFSSYRNNFTLL